jgi:hypothetical protein
MTIVLNGVPLSDIAASTAVTTRAAIEAIAERVQLIKSTLDEINQISRATGAPADLASLRWDIESADTVTDWNSSSAYC